MKAGTEAPHKRCETLKKKNIAVQPAWGAETLVCYLRATMMINWPAVSGTTSALGSFNV